MNFDRQLFKEAFKAGYKKALKESRISPAYEYAPEEPDFYVNGEPCTAGTNPEVVCGTRVLRAFDKNVLVALFKLLSSETFEGVSAKELQITDEDILNNLEVSDEEPMAEEGESLEYQTSDGRWISFPWNW